MPSLKTRLERFSLKATPAALTVLAVFCTAVPLHIPGLKAIMPAFALICIYYWNVFFPGALPYPFLFCLGLLEDILCGLPMGTSSAVNILFALMLARGRRNFGTARFGGIWFGFILMSLAAFAFEWVIMSFYQERMLPLERHMLQWAATCLAYPAVHSALTRLCNLFSL